MRDHNTSSGYSQSYVNRLGPLDTLHKTTCYIGPGQDRGDANFYEKALFVKPTWRLLLEAECNGFECPSRYASIRTFSEPTPRWLGAYDEIRLDSGSTKVLQSS